MSEVVKLHANRGTGCDISFYRDSNGVEVDLILTRGQARHILEAKSGVTFHGDMDQTRSRYDVVSWTRMGEYIGAV